MFCKSKSLRRNNELYHFAVLVEEKKQDRELAAKFRQDEQRRVEVERQLEKKRVQDEKQILLQKQIEENRCEVRKFMEQRAEQRRLYQDNKYKAQLVTDFLEERAQARREYRAAKAQMKIGCTAQEAIHTEQNGARFTWICLKFATDFNCDFGWNDDMTEMPD